MIAWQHFKLRPLNVLQLHLNRNPCGQQTKVALREICQRDLQDGDELLNLANRVVVVGAGDAPLYSERSPCIGAHRAGIAQRWPEEFVLYVGAKLIGAE